MSTKTERLYQRASDIRDGNACGLWLPIIQHLALRGRTSAMIDLAHWLADTDPGKIGSAADRFSVSGLYRRAYRKGDARAAQHLAMTCFNRNDLGGIPHGCAARPGWGP